MICADFEGLISPHHQPCLMALPMLQKLHITGTTFLPFPSVPVEFEQFCAHFKDLFFILFIGLSLNLLGKFDDRLKVNLG